MVDLELAVMEHTDHGVVVNHVNYPECGHGVVVRDTKQIVWARAKSAQPQQLQT